MRMVIAGLALFLAACTVGAADDNGAGARQFVVPLKNSAGIFCSGVPIRDGLVLTAAHCVDDLAPEVGTVLVTGDARFDLALVLAPDAHCPCARIADSDAAMDEQVVVVGYPRGLTQVVTVGTSQGVVEESKELPYGGPRLVTTAQAAGGNSGGGAFVYRAGEYQLVGILVEGLDHLTFSLPVGAINNFLQPAL
jgi:S1-C subfamily serine protease